MATRVQQVDGPFPRAAKRRTRSSYVLFAIEVALWVAWIALAARAPERLEGTWTWVRGLPLVVEGLVWLAAFPWVLGLAVWHSSWEEWLRVLLVGCFAVGWSIAFFPRATTPRRRAEAGPQRR